MTQSNDQGVETRAERLLQPMQVEIVAPGVVAMQHADHQADLVTVAVQSRFPDTDPKELRITIHDLIAASTDAASRGSGYAERRHFDGLMAWLESRGPVDATAVGQDGAQA